MAARGKRPAFTGLIVYRNVEHRYSLLYPEGWHRHDLVDGEGRGVIFTPATGEAATSFSVAASDLGTTVTADDLPALRAGFLEGLRKVPRSRLGWREDYAVGTLVGLEARQSFREGEVWRRRWVRLLYQGSTQVRLIAQGATAAEFAYWLPAFNEMMRTFRFGDWWAELTGQEWLPSLALAAGDTGEPHPAARTD
ncbi:MAG TPA: hypothetical protein VFL91_06305 [Thermomicrobiales bacterium]|nr:hypothetical protein [Thermomicrobiales bacterium]